ncbi:carbohydrate kinase family protein [Tenggerimyces flavus]|uniref:Carbohydrate kinase family protein n=1 Tax=Tenggerimyces flavus TaxID=1708749 RepID=A0ABV7Y6P6_9ACTN|nr:carbohydrate kinase family protein [Tenggerimyces flavus]MBM7785392.1 sugar/nucleoside kinase (ribokinase family) [Tenggerimyces flavus]
MLVLGGLGVDLVVRVPSLPLPSVDSAVVPPIETRVAHPATGLALAFRALSVPVVVFDAVGADPEGALVTSFFASLGVPLHTVVAPGGTRRAVNLVEPGGRRLSFYDGRPSPPPVVPESAYLPLVREARHVHVSIMDFARHALAPIRAAGVTLSTDLHDWDGVAEYHRDFARAADVVFLSTSALGDRFESTMRAILADGVVTVVVATAGADGAYLLTRAGTFLHQPAIPPQSPVVDTNGAGDAFAGGFLSRWLTGDPPERCLLAGALTGAQACTGPLSPNLMLDRETLFVSMS